MKLTGKITVKPFASGSKSAHDAVHLETASGDYVLQRQEDNPFEKSGLEGLSGKNVTVEGELNNYLFMAKEIKELD